MSAHPNAHDGHTCTVEVKCSGCALRQRSDRMPLAAALGDVVRLFQMQHDTLSPACQQPGLPERGRLAFTITPH